MTPPINQGLFVDTLPRLDENTTIAAYTIERAARRLRGGIGPT